MVGNFDLPNFTGSDRIALEQHPYYAFDGAGAGDVVPYIVRPCGDWGGMMNASQVGFGVTTGAEWSLGFNDCECGFFVLGGVGGLVGGWVGGVMGGGDVNGMLT